MFFFKSDDIAIHKLFDACRRNDLNELKNLIENSGVNANTKIRYHNLSDIRILHLASLYSNFKIVKYLVEKAGADINAVTKSNLSALHFACLGGSLEIVKYLVQAGAKVNTIDRNGENISHWASEGGSLEVIKYLIEEAKANIYARHPFVRILHNVSDIHYIYNSKNVLHRASEGGHFEVVKYLVEKVGVDVNAIDDYGQNALHFASKGTHLGIEQHLLQKAGVGNIDTACNDLDINILPNASEGGHLEVVKYLVEETEADINMTDKRGNTALELLQEIWRENAGDDSYYEVYNILKSADIGQKLIAKLELTEEEQLFMASADYSPKYFNNLRSKYIAEKKFLMVETSIEEDSFFNSEDYSQKYEGKYQQIRNATRILGEHLKVAEIEGKIAEGEVLRIEPQSIKGFYIPEDVTNVMASYLTTRDTQKISLVSYPIAKDLGRIEPRFLPLETGLLPQDNIDIGTIDLNTELFLPDTWFAIGYAAGSFAINPGLKCVDNYMDEQTQNRTCSEYYEDVLSIDNFSSTAAAYVKSYMISALSLNSVNGINIQDMYIYQHYPAMLGLACASVPVLLEMVL